MKEIDIVIQLGLEPPAARKRANHITEIAFQRYVDESNLFCWYYQYYDIVGPDSDDYNRDEYLEYKRSAIFYSTVLKPKVNISLLYLKNSGSLACTLQSNFKVFEIYEELYFFAKSIGADMYYDVYGSCTLMTDEFLEKLSIKLGSKILSGEKVLTHTIDTIGRFMAIQAGDDTSVINFIMKNMPKSVSKKIKLSTKPWNDAYSEPQEEEIIVTPSIGGWVFLSSLLLNRILPDSVKEDDTEAFLDGINKLSKKFKKSRWFEFSPKYNIKAYIKSDQGTIKYGVIYSEDENIVMGKKPSELGKDDDPDINFIASKWALDPDSFLYMPVLKEASVTVLNIPY